MPRGLEVSPQGPPGTLGRGRAVGAGACWGFARAPRPQDPATQIYAGRIFSISPGMEPERAQRCALEDKGGSGEDRGFPRPSRATKDWPRARPRATKTRQQPCPAEQSPAPLPAPQSMSVACGPALGAGGRREVHWSAHVNACNIDPRLVTLTLKSKREGTIVSERMTAPFI